MINVPYFDYKRVNLPMPIASGRWDELPLDWEYLGWALIKSGAFTLCWPRQFGNPEIFHA